MITVQPSSSVPPEQVHGLSMHPKVRAVLARGLDEEWTPKDVAELLGMSLRTAQCLFGTGQIHCGRYQGQPGVKTLHRCIGMSVLLYIIDHTDELNQADAVAVLKKLLPLLTDAVLEGVAGACKALISKRSGVLVVVKAKDEGGMMKDENRKPPARPKNVIGFEPHTEFSFVQELTPAASA